MRVRMRRVLAAGAAVVALTAGMSIAGATSAAADTIHTFRGSTWDQATSQAINYVNITDPNCWYAGTTQTSGGYVAQVRCPY